MLFHVLSLQAVPPPAPADKIAVVIAGNTAIRGCEEPNWAKCANCADVHLLDI
jgi:hypothetical protein